MNTDRMPVVFAGHGSPMNAIGDNRARQGWRAVGEHIVENYGKPSAILAVSAHWQARGSFHVHTDVVNPQIMDMWGFPEELYQVHYQPDGDNELARRVLGLLGDRATADNEWGIDHGVWSVLATMFPEADVPVVPMSVDMAASADDHYRVGADLRALRDEGVLVFASGNVVHNLMMVDWDSDAGADWADRFDKDIHDAIAASDFGKVVHYEELPDARLAVPTTDHFLPLLVALGAAQTGDAVATFNNYRELGSMSMTSYIFG